MTYTLGGISLGVVVSDRRATSNSNIILPALPGDDSSGTMVISMGGAKHLITVNGIYKGTQQEVNNFLNQLKIWGGGGQQDKLLYHSDTRGDIYVFVDNVDQDDKTYSDIHKISYTLNLIEVGGSF